MPMDERELSCFMDIYLCAKDIVEFTSGISFDEFENNKMRKLAVERQLEVIGQAANKISLETQMKYSIIPWSQIIGLRNKLAHDYGDILAKRIWEICIKSVPELFRILESMPDLKQYI